MENGALKITLILKSNFAILCYFLIARFSIFQRFFNDKK
jgi:hypothetical protein